MTHKFPDAEAIEAAVDAYLLNAPSSTFRSGRDKAAAKIKPVLPAALQSYHTRTGIDLADVSEKLAAGTHVLVPVAIAEKLSAKLFDGIVLDGLLEGDPQEPVITGYELIMRP